MKTKTSVSKIIWSLVYIILICLWLYPLLYALASSFKPLSEMFARPLSLLPQQPSLANYKELFQRLPFKNIIFNTLFIAALATLIKLLVAFFAAYGLNYYEFKSKKIVYLILISSVFIPYSVRVLPNYLFMIRTNLFDSLWGVILAELADASGILILLQSMRNIPSSIIESAKLDNIKDGLIMKDIVFPLVRPQFISIAIWFFVGSMNEYLWPSIVIKSKENYTLPQALQMFISAEVGIDFPILMAITVVTIAIPVILYLIFRKQIIATFSLKSEEAK